MTRFIDRGAVTAGWVGVGVAVVVAISFLLVIPIEPIFWLCSLPAGVLVGYYANARSGRPGGMAGRTLANALWAGAVTGLALVLLLLGVKALFFYADDGYRDAGRLTCAGGAACVYERYLAAGRGDELRGVGVDDVDTFTAFYWSRQFTTAGTILGLTAGGGLLGGLLYVVGRMPRARAGT